VPDAAARISKAVKLLEKLERTMGMTDKEKLFAYNGIIKRSSKGLEI
jgi:hypothetical protein